MNIKSSDFRQTSLTSWHQPGQGPSLGHPGDTTDYHTPDEQLWSVLYVSLLTPRVFVLFCTVLYWCLSCLWECNCDNGDIYIAGRQPWSLIQLQWGYYINSIELNMYFYKNYLNNGNNCRKWSNNRPKRLSNSLFLLEINLRDDAILADIPYVEIQLYLHCCLWRSHLRHWFHLHLCTCIEILKTITKQKQAQISWLRMRKLTYLIGLGDSESFSGQDRDSFNLTLCRVEMWPREHEEVP